MATSRRVSSETSEKRPHIITITLCVLGLLVPIGIAVFTYSYHRSQNAGLLSILILEGNAAGPPVADAEVSLNLPEIDPEHTDSKGRVFFRLSKDLGGRDGRIFIRKEGFANYNQQLLLQPRSDFYPIYLQRASVAKVPDAAPDMRAKGPPVATGDAVTKGESSPAVTGSGNSVTYGSSAPPHKKKDTR
jgi:hypothetical protein